MKTEVPLALERRKESGIGVLGIYLEDCNFSMTYLRKTQIVPQYKGRLYPIESWDKKGEYWITIKDAIEECS
ncbi:MAG: hypothetical protein AAGH46_12385, partial [Bacteroidota bacterium]